MTGMRSDFYNQEELPQGLGQESLESPNIFKVEDLPDGTSIYEIGEKQEEIEEDNNEFNENLIDYISNSELEKIVTDLLEDIDEDRKSRSEWEETITKGLKYLGVKIEEFKNYPFMNCCAAFDTTLSTALLRFWSTARAELFPASGPAQSQVVGNVTDELEKQGEKVKRWMNYYLTIVDKEYYPDSERLLMYLGLVGCAFRKVYSDPINNQPKARFIDPQDFIVNNNCVTILSSDRLTHVQYLNKKEIILRQMSGFYSDEAIKNINDEMEDESNITKTVKIIEGITDNNNENHSLFKIYEVHADLDLNGFEHVDQKSNQTGMPLPYIVTILVSEKKILSIRRNWIEGNPEYKRREHFVQYNYQPGFGIYGLGLVHLLGSNAIALTSILRQLIDSGTLKNFPGGLKQKGLRVEKNDKCIGPSEFWDVETGGAPIQDTIMMMPYPEPSVVLKDLYNQLVSQTQQVANTSETQVAEAKSDAPVGTTLALLEVANKLQSSILRSMHFSLSNELELLFQLFSEGLETPFKFLTRGNSQEISNSDFNENIRIIPVSDPNLTTSTQRILRSEAILRLAQSAPELHNMRNAYHRMYVSMNVEDIDRLIPPEEQVVGLDPITENMNMIQNKPAKAELWQDHPAHMMTHTVFGQQHPECQPQVDSHNREHMALQYLIDMQMQMGIQIPDMEQLKNPEVQNAIALKAAEIASQQQQQMQQQQPLDPNQVMMADIEERKFEAILKDEESKRRQETEAFKAQMRFEADMKKLDIQQEMAEEKNETDIDLAEMKHEDQMELAHESRQAAKESKPVKK